jgi:inorganic pyrophosphatase
MTVHLWHNLSAGPNPPDVIYVVVEVPKGSRNKYEYSKKAGVIKLDRVLYSSLHYPGDYGFIPQSYWGDGDPLDVLVMMTEPTYPGCVIEARPLGMPATDPNFNDIRSMDDVTKHFPNEVAHFFMTYKQLENVEVKNEGWVGIEETKAAIVESMRLYRETFPPSSTNV